MLSVLAICSTFFLHDGIVEVYSCSSDLLKLFENGLIWLHVLGTPGLLASDIEGSGFFLNFSVFFFATMKFRLEGRSPNFLAMQTIFHVGFSFIVREMLNFSCFEKFFPFLDAMVGNQLMLPR